MKQSCGQIQERKTMGSRHRLVFMGMICFTVVWFVIALICQSRVAHLDPKQTFPDATKSPQPAALFGSFHHLEHHNQVPFAQSYLKRLQLKHLALNSIGRLFYQLDIHSKDVANVNQSIDAAKHKQDTLGLGNINDAADQYVRMKGYNLFAFNLLVSNRIGLMRPIPDTRHKLCPKLEHANESTIKYQGVELVDQASIIITYFNEAPSALLRTVYSVLYKTPQHLIKEILVIDDFSDSDFSHSKIRPFINSDLVKLLRTEKREGLIRARLFGASVALGNVLVYLDSHVEANQNWLEPLMKTVQENRTTIASPMIDLINADTFLYTASPMVRGGLNWALNFRWDSIPSANLKTYEEFVKPVETATIAGGLYAIDREFFNRIGQYDPAMELWGGENIEISLRTWMCGGRLLILPCSRVGHVFRKRRPYGPKPDQPDSLLINSHRTARVWLGDYISHYYEHNPDAKYLISGDISKRLELSERLKCHNFTWFLDNVYPRLKEEFVVHGDDSPSNSDVRTKKLFNTGEKPNEKYHVKRRRGLQFLNADVETRGVDAKLPAEVYPPKPLRRFQIRARQTNLCIESRGGFLGKGFTGLNLNHCAKLNRNPDGEVLISNSTILDQLWSETNLHDFRLGNSQCLVLVSNLAMLRTCQQATIQTWLYDSQTAAISNPNSTLCLSVEQVRPGEPIIVGLCDKQMDKVFNNLSSKKLNKSNTNRKIIPHLPIKNRKLSQEWDLMLTKHE